MFDAKGGVYLMFPPDTKKLVTQAHDMFLKQMASKSQEEFELPRMPNGEQHDIEMTKTMLKFVRNLVADVLEENNRLLIEALREKGIEL